MYEDDVVSAKECQIAIKGGVQHTIQVKPATSFHYVFTQTVDTKQIKKKQISVKEQAPFKKGDVVAKMEYSLGDTVLGTVDLVAEEDVKEQKFHHAFIQILQRYVNIY